MYDRIRDLLIGENKNAPQPGESREDFLKRVGKKAHAEVAGKGKRQPATNQNILKAIRGRRSR